MYTLDHSQKSLINYGLIHFLFTIFLALFGAVYEKFSHEVYSYYMIYAFAIPLILGVFPALFHLRLKRPVPGRTAMDLWSFGIITLAVGSVFKGILDIYGTTNRLVIVYPIAGMILIGIGLLQIILPRRRPT